MNDDFYVGLPPYLKDSLSDSRERIGQMLESDVTLPRVSLHAGPTLNAHIIVYYLHDVAQHCTLTEFERLL